MYKPPRRNPFLEPVGLYGWSAKTEQHRSPRSTSKHDLFDPAEYAKLGWKLPLFAAYLIICGGAFSFVPPLVNILWYAIWTVAFFIIFLSFIFMILGWYECAVHGKSIIRHAVAATLANLVVGGFLIWLFIHFLSLRQQEISSGLLNSNMIVI